MKSSAKKVHYISAYPLKALNLPAEEYQSAIQIRSASTGKTANRFRVTAMIDPYGASDSTTSVDPAVETEQQSPVFYNQYE